MTFENPNLLEISQFTWHYLEIYLENPILLTQRHLPLNNMSMNRNRKHRTNPAIKLFMQLLNLFKRHYK